MTSWINPACFRLAERARQRRRRLLFQKLHPGWLSKSLGQGAYSTAFRIGRSKVCKITDIQDPTLCWFGRYVRRFPNPHWPRIHRQIQLGNSHFVTWMERLRPLDRASKDRVRCVDVFISNAGTGGASRLKELAQFGFGGLWEACPKRLRQPLLDCRRAAERAGFWPDAKRDAFMRRPGGILVLADPFLVRRIKNGDQKGGAAGGD